MYIIKPYGFFPKVKFGLDTFLISPIFHGQQFILNRAGWYIIPLFIVHIINVLIRKILHKNKIEINEWLYFAISIAIGIFGVFLSQPGYTNEWHLLACRTLYFIPFYSFGILYNKYEQHDKLNSIIYFSIIITIALYYIYTYGSMPTVSPSWAKFGTNLINPFIIGILGIAFWLRIAKILEPALGKNKYVNLIADNTYSIMINHFLGMMLIKSIFAYLSIHTSLCEGFKMHLFKTNVYYYYLPHNLRQMSIVYLVFGIVFSIYFGKCISKLWEFIKIKYTQIRRNFIKQSTESHR